MLTSCCAAWFLTVRGPVPWGLGTPVLLNTTEILALFTSFSPPSSKCYYFPEFYFPLVISYDSLVIIYIADILVIITVILPSALSFTIAFY